MTDNNYSPLRTRRDKGRLLVLKAIALLHLFLPIAAGAATNYCYSEPCKQGGTCTPTEAGSGGFFCACPPQTTGVVCDITITCASSPCKNGASCVEDFKGGGFRCSCLPGYTGRLCEIKLTPILRNVLTTSINQTAWTFSWNEPSTPALSRYWYTVAKQVTGGGTTQVVPRREFASKGPGTFVQIMVVGLRPRNTYTVTIIPCSDSLCYIPSTLTATTLAACGLGRFSNITSGSCQACPRGFYQSDKDEVKTSCSVCPSDNKARRGTTLTTASNSIKDCYFAPSVDVLFPAYGPVAGGTVLLFRMAYFDSCARFSVRVGGAVCLNAAKTKEGVTCETSEVNKAGKAVANITCQHTNKAVHYASAEFEYKPDPIIHSTGTNKTFIRGGISINVAGEHLKSAYKITMETMRVISNERVKFVSQPCEVQSDDLMYCRTADMSANFEVKTGIKLPAKPPNQLARMVARSPGRSGRVKRSTTTSQSIEELNSTISFYISAFHMDGVDTYKDFRKTHPQHSSLAVYFDPEILVFSEQDNIKEYTSGNLRIDGSRLQWQVRDFDISIGKEKCPLKEVYHNAIYCNPPSNPPEISLDHPQKQGLPHVMVKVGFLRYSVGFLRYPVDTCTLGVFCDTLVIVGVALLGVFFLLVITVAWCCSARRRRKRRERKREERAQELRRISQNLNKGEPHNLQMRSLPHPQRTYQDPASPRGVATMPAGNGDESRGFWEDLDDNNLKATLKDCLIAPRRLELGEGIGEGHFGKVYKGKLLDRDFSSHKIVAVKTIQGKRFTQKEFKSFLSEAVIMKDFDHINVLSLYGVVIKEDKPYVILPYMEHGDLKSFIINPAQPLTVRELLQFGYQIAQGMSYLARKKFVHRDLATRNCMVNKALTIKIADFGLSRDIHRKDYYAAQDKERPLPVKWMAPESLETGIFTAKTDVWAFGVVLWELMTRGCTPYPDVGNMDIKRYLQNGRRMTKPGHAPDAVYQIMMLCWEKDPKTRPDFAQLVRRLQAILNDKTTGGGDYLSPVTSTYYIQPVSD